MAPQLSKRSLFHIALRSDWQAAQLPDSYAPASLAAEGFIHLSNLDQVTWVANQFYRAQPGLVLLCIDPERLQAELRYDAVPGHGTFPHLYGPLNPSAVTAVVPWEPSETGEFYLPETLTPNS